jgi:DNA polymerase III delta prime subunit
MKIIGYKLVLEILDEIINKKELPNLIINGQSGVGKNLLVNYLLDNLYGEKKKDKVLNLNICDERGISVIREKIKCFANLQVNQDGNKPSYKVIVFDNAEHISSDAQNALRRIIEMTNNLTRFIFITKNPKNLIDPIISRCLFLNLNFEENEEKVKYYKSKFKSVKLDMIRLVIEKSKNNFDLENNILKELNNSKTERDKVKMIESKVLEIRSQLKDININKIIELLNEIKNDNDFNLLDLTDYFCKNLIKDKKMSVEQIFKINNEYYNFNKLVTMGGDINLNFVNFYLNLSKII